MYTLRSFKRNEKKHDKFILNSSFKRVYSTLRTQFKLYSRYTTPKERGTAMGKERKVNNSPSLSFVLLYSFLFGFWSWILCWSSQKHDFMAELVSTSCSGHIQLNTLKLVVWFTFGHSGCCWDFRINTDGREMSSTKKYYSVWSNLCN